MKALPDIITLWPQHNCHSVDANGSICKKLASVLAMSLYHNLFLEVIRQDILDPIDKRMRALFLVQAFGMPIF